MGDLDSSKFKEISTIFLKMFQLSLSIKINSLLLSIAISKLLCEPTTTLPLFSNASTRSFPKCSCLFHNQRKEFIVTSKRFKSVYQYNYKF